MNANGERFYLFSAAWGFKPIAPFEGFESSAAAMAHLKTINCSRVLGVCRGPYTRDAFVSICAANRWQIVGDSVVEVPFDRPKIEPAFCPGCGETIALCDCNRCEECGLLFEACECDETNEHFNLTSPDAPAPGEQLSLF